MPVTMWGQVIDGLLTALRSRSGYRAPSDPALGIPVFDGPEVHTREERTDQLLIIGWAGDPAGEQDSGTGRQQLIAFASSSRPTEENGTVTCMAIGQSGDKDPATARALAFAIVGDVDTALRGTAAGPTLGIDPAAGNGQLLWALIGGEMRVSQFLSEGAVCEVEFEINYKARI